MLILNRIRETIAEDPVFPNSDPGHSTLNKGRFFKIKFLNILDNFKSFFCFQYFLMSYIQQTSPDPVKFGPETDPGLTEDVWNQKYEKKAFLKYSMIEF